MSRGAAWEVLQFVSAGAYADVALDRVLKRWQLSSLDRALMTELAYGAIRQRLLLDCWLDYCGKISVKKQPPRLRWLLHLGLYQIFFMERIPNAAAVNTTVELAKNSKLVKLAPVVNGILRAAIRENNAGTKLPLPEGLPSRLAQAQSIPIWFAECLIRWRGEKGAEAIAKAANQVPPFDLRVNCLRVEPKKIQELFDASGIQSSLINGALNGLQVSTTGAGNLRLWPGYKEGYWCVQDRSSQWVAPLLDPQPGEKVLDACAAPGCKTTHIAEIMGDKGEVWAVDRSSKRLKKLEENLNRLGIRCVTSLVADSSSLLKIKPEWKEYFQRILLDVPCSGLGTLSRHPDARWRVSLEKIEELKVLQAKLLQGVFPLLAPGGRIVYSTCTIHPEENTFQIEKFVSRNSELDLLNEKQIWPEIANSGDGFYAATLQRRS